MFSFWRHVHWDVDCSVVPRSVLNIRKGLVMLANVALYTWQYILAGINTWSLIYRPPHPVFTLPYHKCLEQLKCRLIPCPNEILSGRGESLATRLVKVALTFFFRNMEVRRDDIAVVYKNWMAAECRLLSFVIVILIISLFSIALF